jgi:hypothetical protein
LIKSSSTLMAKKKNYKAGSAAAHRLVFCETERKDRKLAAQLQALLRCWACEASYYVEITAGRGT